MPTLTSTEILTDILDAFQVRVPMLSAFNTEFTSQRLHLGQTIMAHIAATPAAGDYDAGSGGYENDSQEASTLLTDLPVVATQHKHVTVSLTHLLAMSNAKYTARMSDMAYSLGKTMLDYVLGLAAAAANVTHSTTETIANTDRDTLGTVRLNLNTQRAASTGRWGIVNSAFADALDGDTRIASSDYEGQRTGADGYVHLTNIAGFANIWEYPDLPTTANLSALFGDRRLITLATGLPDHSAELAASMGIPISSRFEVVTHPETGLSLLGIKWHKPGIEDLFLTLTLLYGARVGAAGGSANDATDRAGIRVITA